MEEEWSTSRLVNDGKKDNVELGLEGRRNRGTIGETESREKSRVEVERERRIAGKDGRCELKMRRRQWQEGAREGERSGRRLKEEEGRNKLETVL